MGEERKINWNELKSNDVVEFHERRNPSTYTPPVKIHVFKVAVEDGLIKLVDMATGNVAAVNFESGRLLLRRKRGWTDEELAALVGSKLTDGESVRLVTEYDKGTRRFTAGQKQYAEYMAEKFFGEKYDLVPIEITE